MRTDQRTEGRGTHALPKGETKTRQVIAYLRTSTDKQDTAAQQQGIVEYAKRNGLQPLRFVEEQVSGRVAIADRKLGKDVLPSLGAGDVLLVSELSRLGRSTLDVLQALKLATERGAEVHVAKGGHKVDGSMPSKVFVHVMALAAEIERDLLSARTKEGLERARRNGKRLGRPAGLPPRSKLDARAEDIKAFAAKGIGPANLARVFDTTYTTMAKWLRNNKVSIRREGVRT